jgi:hypothetical protein
MSDDGQTKRGPSGNAVGIDGPEYHARSTCAYPYATPCRYCIPDAAWAVLLTTVEKRHDPHEDSIDYALGFGRMIDALLDYWERQESMPPEQAIRKLVSERDVMFRVLCDMADEIDAGEPYSVWAKRVVESVAKGVG